MKRSHAQRLIIKPRTLIGYVLYALLCSRADLLTGNVDLKHKRKNKKNFRVDFFKIEYLYIKKILCQKKCENK